MATMSRQERRAAGRARARRAGRTPWGRRAFAALVLALPALVAGPAAAQDFEAPNVVPSVPETGSLPGSIFVRWEHNANPCPGIGCVWDYSVERENPQRPETAEKRVDNVKGSERLLFDSGLQPNTEHRYRVCAFFITEDGDVECSEWTAGRTGPPEQPRQPNRPPRPRIVEEHAGETWIGIKWEAGHNYDSYFINVAGPFGTARGPRELRTIKHDDDGTWGYQRVDGLLPGRAYDFAVQGCRPTFLGIGDDQCFDWSTKVSFPTQAYPLHSGPHTCAPPFVWREAFDGDTVCVEVSRRTQVAADNAQAQARRAYTCTPPNCTFTGPDTCKVPYVWREARPSDHVCVPVRERSQVASENGLARERLADPP